MPRYSLRPTRARRAFFGALGLVAPLTHDTLPPSRRAALVAKYAQALADEAVALWQATRRRIVLLTDYLGEDEALARGHPSQLITFDRFR